MASAIIYTCGADCPGNLLIDPGFEPGSQPLLPHGTTVVGQWDAEAASLETGPVGPIDPFVGTGMLRINNTTLAVSQVVQNIDVTHCRAEIDNGTAGFNLAVRLNGNVTVPVTGSLTVLAQTAPGISFPTKLATFSHQFALDTDPGTWEYVSFCDLPLPAGTNFVVVQIGVRNTGALSQGDALAFADDCCLQITELKGDGDCLLAGRGFEPGCHELVNFGSPLLDRWAAENAVIVGDVPPYTPKEGLQMLQINNPAGGSSRVHQNMDVSECREDIDNGTVGFILKGCLNGNTAEPVSGRLIVYAQNSSTFHTFGTEMACYETPFVLDQDDATWECFTVCGIPLPPGTTHLASHIEIDSSPTIPAGDPLAFADDFCLQLIQVKIPDYCRPDLTIGRSVGAQLGNDIYNNTGAGQKVAQTTGRFRPRPLRFIFRTQNDGIRPDVITLKGTAGNRKCRVFYRRISGGAANITAAMTGVAGYTVNLNPGQVETGLLIVRPRLRLRRSTKQIRIDAFSCERDTVKAEVRMR